MPRVRLCLVALSWLILANVGRADPPALMTAQGVIDKVEKDGLTIRPRGADGRFEKAVALRLTGTSQVSLLTSRTQQGKVVIVQKDTSPKDLSAKQAIAVIYTTGADGPVLLSAVVQAPADK